MRRHVVAGLLMFGLLCGVAPAVASDASKVGTPKAVRDFPMWKLLPTASFATLMDRTKSGFRAGIYVYRKGLGKSGAPKACVQQVTVREEAGPSLAVSTGAPECSPLYPDRGFNVTLGSYASSEQTVIGLVTNQRATRKVEIRLVPGEPINVGSKALSQGQAMKAHLPRLRYVAMALPRTGCLESITGVDAAGATLFETGVRACPE